MFFYNNFFKSNEEWYFYDGEKHFVYKLTEKAPKEAVEDYLEYLNVLLKNGEISKVIYKEILKDLETTKAKQLFGLGGE